MVTGMKRCARSAALVFGLALVLAAAPAQAQVITFDDLPLSPVDAYGNPQAESVLGGFGSIFHYGAVVDSAG